MDVEVDWSHFGDFPLEPVGPANALVGARLVRSPKVAANLVEVVVVVLVVFVVVAKVGIVILLVVAGKVLAGWPDGWGGRGEGATL